MTERATHGPVALLAGSGGLPALVTESLDRAGRDYRILAFRGFANREMRRRADAVLDLLDIRRALACLDSWRPSEIALAGGMQRPTPAAVFNAFAAVRNQAELAALMRRGDDSLLRGVIGLLEEKGFAVVGVHDLAPDLLAAPGQYGAHAPGPDDLMAVEIGMRMLADLSPYDVGQAAVVAGERVLAIEGPEGTDRMLTRTGGLSRWRRWRRLPPTGVLVKRVKHGQDLRVDLPAIGPRTLSNAAKAGLRGVAVAAGHTLILDLARTVAEADRLGLFLVGRALEAKEAAAP